MYIKKGIGAAALCVGLFASGGCGFLSSAPANPATFSKESIPVSFHGLKKWRITFTPDLNFNIRYDGGVLSNPQFTLWTKPVHGEHWHRFYSTGPGMVKSRAWGSTLTGGEQFVGQAKLVVTWMTGNHAHKGYAIYRVQELKSR